MFIYENGEYHYNLCWLYTYIFLSCSVLNKDKFKVFVVEREELKCLNKAKHYKHSVLFTSILHTF